MEKHATHAPRVGFEPTTLRLTAACSTVELPRILVCVACYLYYRQRIPKINATRAKDQPLDTLFKKEGMYEGGERCTAYRVADGCRGCHGASGLRACYGVYVSGARSR